MVCVGRDSRLDWIRTTRPALEKHFARQLSNLAPALVVRFWNTSGVGRPWKREHPKYWPNDELWGMVNMPPTVCLSIFRVLVENKILDLWKFTSWPDCVQKVSSTSFNVRHAWEVALQNSRLSSANRRHGMRTAAGAILTPIPALGFKARVCSHFGKNIHTNSKQVRR